MTPLQKGKKGFTKSQNFNESTAKKGGLCLKVGRLVSFLCFFDGSIP